MLTMRNWLIGYYIVEFEQKGKERAQYGDKLLKRLEDAVNQKGLTMTLFKNSRRFYRAYPQMVQLFRAAPQFFRQIGPTVSDEFVSAPEDVIGRLSFSHICEIEWIDDPLVRYFYEQECMRCTWSVRELRRQSTDVFRMSGKSPKKIKLRLGLRAKNLLLEAYVQDYAREHIIR